MEHIVFLERDSLDAQVRRPAFVRGSPRNVVS